MPAKRPTRSDAQDNRNLVDAVREFLGKAPLYGADTDDVSVDGPRYVSSAMHASIGSGNRSVVGGNSFPNN